MRTVTARPAVGRCPCACHPVPGQPGAIPRHPSHLVGCRHPFLEGYQPASDRCTLPPWTSKPAPSAPWSPPGRRPSWICVPSSTMSPFPHRRSSRWCARAPSQHRISSPVIACGDSPARSTPGARRSRSPFPRWWCCPASTTGHLHRRSRMRRLLFSGHCAPLMGMVPRGRTGQSMFCRRSPRDRRITRRRSL